MENVITCVQFQTLIFCCIYQKKFFFGVTSHYAIDQPDNDQNLRYEEKVRR